MSSTVGFHKDQLPTYLADLKLGVHGDSFNGELEYETQTDKERVKLCSCTECGRALVVSTFYVPANARCSACKGGKGADGGAKATVAVPQAGRTDPARAVNLADCLVNRAFGQALCPAHPDDEAHEMELKSVSHSEHYGPSEIIGYKNGRPEYRQTAPGETVMWQCLKCKATVSYSTTAQVQFLRQNEIRGDKHVNGWAEALGAREEENHAG